MDCYELTELNKKLSQAESMRKTCHEMAVKSLNWRQNSSAQKGELVNSQRISLLNEQINKLKIRNNSGVRLNSANNDSANGGKATLQLKLFFPLFWDEETKRKENLVGSSFFILKTHDNIYESDLIDIDNTSTTVSTSQIRLTVDLDSEIEINLHLFLTDSYSLKKFNKTKENDADAALKFPSIGHARILVRELVQSLTPLFLFELVIDKRFVKSSIQKGLHNSLQKISIQNSGSFADLATMPLFGSKLHTWNKASLYFSVFPDIIKSQLSKFTALVIIGENLKKLSCIKFEGEFLRCYDCVETYMGNPYLSIKISNISLSADLPHFPSICIYEASISAAVISFTLSDYAKAFLKYFKAYSECLKTWGVTIDANNEEKSSRDVVNEIISKPENILTLLNKKPMLETPFCL